MNSYVVLGLVGMVVVTLVIGGLLARLWKQREERAIARKWVERERLLDRRKEAAARHEVLRRRSRSRRPTYLGRRGARRPDRGRASGRR